MTASKESEPLKGSEVMEKGSMTPGEAFDKMLEYVGGNGRWQIAMFFFTSFCGIFTAFHNLGAGNVNLYNRAQCMCVFLYIILIVYSYVKCYAKSK